MPRDEDRGDNPKNELFTNRNLWTIWTLLLIMIFVSCGGGDGTRNVSKDGIHTPGVFIVGLSGEVDYNDIQSAVNDAVAGDVILVKNGIYRGRLEINESGTSSNPITIKNYPDQNPVIIPGENDIDRVEINGEHIVFEGFEVKGGTDGVKLYGSNNTIRNCYIHDNLIQGILIVAASNITIEDNIIENNGSAKGSCIVDGQYSPKHCHGIYISDYYCAGLQNIVIRNNHIIGHPGRGIQWNGAGCDSKMSNTIVEGNIIENNSWGMALFYNVEGAIIKNNIFMSNTRPDTDDITWTFIGIWGSNNNTIESNEFYSSLSDLAPLEVFDSVSADNFVNNNFWRTSSEDWVWMGSWRSDWKNYPAVTGWDIDGDICDGCD